MKSAYPIIMTPDKNLISVYVPDFDINTQGKDFADAINMARDAISLIGVDMEDDGKELPGPSDCSSIHPSDGGIVSLVDVDFSVYRRKMETKTIRKNCTLPSWLCYEAEEAGLNFSQVLQNALKQELQL